ncbi:MAG: gliding motility-associated ABC transporter substrate-binding protein GldG [Ferruginibacter sp.]
MAKRNSIFRGKYWILPALVILIIINIAASKWHARVDLTNEKRFTLSNSTIKLLKSLKEPVEIDVFLKGNFPSGFKNLSSSTNDILQEFREVAGPKLRYRFISPDEMVGGSETSYADSLPSLGLVPINLTSQIKEGQQQQFVYPFALVHYNDDVVPVILYQGKTPIISFSELNSSEAMLEYNLAEAISKIVTTEKTLIGYATGNGEPTGDKVYDLIENILLPNYNLATFNLESHPFIPKEIKVLMVVKPKAPFTDIAKLKLDQYIMRGGKLFMLIDKLDAEMDSLQIKNEVIAYDRELNLEDLLFKYGVRINSDLVMDLQCDYLPFDVNGNGQYELLPWNYFPVIESKSNHPINKNLGFVSGRFVNSMDTVGAAGINKTILLSSSANSRTIGTPALISGKENVMAPEDDKFKRSSIPIAVLLEGKFESLFKNRLSTAMRDSLTSNGETFISQSSMDNKIIIVSDGDIVLNDIMKGNQPIPMGMNLYTYGSQREFPFANRDFVKNCLEYLVDMNNLSEAKGKDYSVRLLDTKRVNNEKESWQLLNLILPALVVIIFGLIFQAFRKRKFTRRKL